MIPKIIHYCWFGNQPLPESAQKCITSWKKHMPDYEIKEWNEDNFDVTQNNFIKEAYKNKRWAFVSDFARVKALYDIGGFYLDTDMEIKNSLNDFLHHRAICGFEVKGIPFSAFWGVEKGHILAKKMKNYYELNEYNEEPNTAIFSRLLVTDFGADPNVDKYQELREGLILYPSYYFSLDLPINYVTHHFSGSWCEDWSSEQNHYKDTVNMYGLLQKLIEKENAKQIIHNVVSNKQIIQIDEILNVIPMRYILKYIYNNFLSFISPNKERYSKKGR